MLAGPGSMPFRDSDQKSQAGSHALRIGFDRLARDHQLLDL